MYTLLTLPYRTHVAINTLYAPLSAPADEILLGRKKQRGINEKICGPEMQRPVRQDYCRCMAGVVNRRMGGVEEKWATLNITQVDERIADMLSLPRNTVWSTRSSLLDCHVLKGFGIYMIGIMDRLYEATRLGKLQSHTEA